MAGVFFHMQGIKWLKECAIIKIPFLLERDFSHVTGSTLLIKSLPQVFLKNLSSENFSLSIVMVVDHRSYVATVDFSRSR